MLAYFDCFAGISGDMTLGALVDLGVPLQWLEGELRKLPLDGFALKAEPVARGGLTAQRVDVVLDHHQPYRHWAQIKALIAASPLADRVKAGAIKVFERLAVAEAAVHRVPVDQVHFHEVGATDAIVDIVGAVLGLDYLGVSRVVCARIPLGSGTTTCQHGILPVPAPATVAILKGIPVCGGARAHEMTTPTGAAIAAGLADGFGPLPDMTPAASGLGAGSRDLGDFPNALRIVIGEPADSPTIHAETLVVMTATIDDMSGEWFGFVMEKLFDAGALDVWWIPVQMKKNRPGTMIQALCRQAQRRALVDCLLTETTTTGVRFHTEQRAVLKRQVVTVDSPFGPVKVKAVEAPDGTVHFVPEYEECRRIALARNLPLRRVFQAMPNRPQS